MKNVFYCLGPVRTTTKIEFENVVGTSFFALVILFEPDARKGIHVTRNVNE